MPSLVPWHAASSDPREALKTRFVVYTRVAAITFIVLAVLVSAAQLTYSRLIPTRSDALALLPAAGILPMLGAWWFARGARSVRALHAADAALGLFMGLYLGAAAYLIPDRAPNIYLPFIFVTLCVFSRALVVPSTGKRTLGVATLTVVPLLVAYSVLALNEPWRLDIPPPVFIGGACALSAAAVALAWVGSDITYGLRVAARDALRLGQYTLEEKLGEGAMGEVYRASHSLLRRPTAIKVLKSEGAGKRSMERFEREVQLTSQLTHPNTISIYDYGTTPDGKFYYVMEYVSGIDLERLVLERGAMPAARVIHLLEQICSALDEAHSRGLIHRDIKPANLMVCQRGDRRDAIKVLDFGLAKDLADDSGLTGAVVAGTPAFLAPDMIRDPNAVTTASDIYALGVTAYFLATGTLVFDGRTVVDICMQHLSATPQPMAARTSQPIPAELEALVMQCLAKDPANRPATARAMAKALRQMAVTHPWTEEDAIAWWADSSGGAELAIRPESSSSFSPVTMSIDLADRHSQS